MGRESVGKARGRVNRLREDKRADSGVLHDSVFCRGYHGWTSCRFPLSSKKSCWRGVYFRRLAPYIGRTFEVWPRIGKETAGIRWQ
jgi:hypothetical protein